MGLDLFVASSPVLARRPPIFLVISGNEFSELDLQGVNTRLQHLGNAGNDKHLIAILN
jgi:hypothetical protein